MTIYDSTTPQASNFQDITNLVTGRLTVLQYAGRLNGRTYWTCRCECGTELDVEAYNLKAAHTKSCGCYSKDFPAARTHGLYHTAERRAFSSAKNRCNNPNNEAYRYYGGKGVKFRIPSVQAPKYSM